MPRYQDLGKRDTSSPISRPAISNDGSNPFGNGFYVARFDPGNLPRMPCEIYRMVSRAPAGTSLELWVDSEVRTTTQQAAANEWTASGDAIDFTPGQSIIVYWNTAAAAPYLAIYLRREL